MRVRPVILAAGKGTRMGGELAKVLVPLRGQPLLSYQLDTLAETAFLPAALVVGYQKEQVEERFGQAYTYVYQEELLGTGHALTCARQQLAGTADCFLVMYADNPLLSRRSMEELVLRHQAEQATLSLATVVSDNPIFHNFGRILRDDRGAVRGIREIKDCSPAEAAIKEVNPGLYCFSDAWVWEALAQIQPANAQGEYYLTDLVEIALQQGEKVVTTKLQNWQEAVGINTPDQLALVESYLA